jgi:putative effector of murein hydrolase
VRHSVEHPSLGGRSLLFLAIVTMPLQEYFPQVAGMSISFLIFFALALYSLVNFPRNLSVVLLHPVFIAAYVFIGVSVLLEFSSPLSRYSEIVRFGQMIVGAVSVAALCKDRSTLSACLYGYLAAALWVSVLLYMSSYGTLQSIKADDFSEAEMLREQAFDQKPVGANINSLGFLCAQGSIIAFALSLFERLKRLRPLFLGIVAFCLIASFLPMSRGVAVSFLASFAAMLYAQGFRYGRTLIVTCFLGICVYLLVPDSVWSRMKFSTETGESGKMESRAQVYTTALDRLPEYIVAGVGAGNFHNDWGYKKWWTKEVRGVRAPIAAHNTPLAITIYWGVIGLSTFMWHIWCIYRSIPLRCGRDELSLALLGIIILLGLSMLQTHNFYDKQFALGIGMLVGARQWIWRTGIVPTGEGSRYP